MNRDDLRMRVDQPWDPQATRPVTDAELASLGLVQRPVCGECDGSGESGEPTWAGGPGTYARCPSCGGSGFGRLVALDGIDVEGLRAEREIYGLGAQTDRLIHQVLAVADQNGAQE